MAWRQSKSQLKAQYPGRWRRIQLKMRKAQLRQPVNGESYGESWRLAAP
jgi:hypothetical protein